jgi:hypothetical protein
LRSWNLSAVGEEMKRKTSTDNRYIPEAERKALRAEVNFGCPIPDCGSPYLTYHHFDPPYREGQSHDPRGMIALCLPHHKAADVGTWTTEQLRALKTQPFLRWKAVSGRLDWLRRDVVVLAGGNLAVNPGVLLEVDSKKVIWTTRAHDQSLLLNFDLADGDGKEVLRLENNEWIVTGEIDDLRASASANSIRVAAPNRGVTLEIRFSTFDEQSLKADCERTAAERAGRPRLPPDLISLVPAEVLEMATPSHVQMVDELWKPFTDSGISWPAMRVTITGRITYPVPLMLTQKKLAVRGQRVLRGNRLFVPDATLLAISSQGEVNVVKSRS